MNHFKDIQVKLEQFIKKYYVNELLKGCILFFTLGVLYFLFTLFIETILWLNPTARTFLFWCFVIVETVLFIKFIALPLAKLFKLQQGLSLEAASKIIGTHFSEVNDKLLNVLQLHQQSQQSELLLASIDQKASQLKPIPFKMAVNFKQNIKYLKYAAVPLILIALIYLTGQFNGFSESYGRVVNYNTAYEPPAPFQFFIVNDSLTAVEDTNFKLLVTTAGRIMPEDAQIVYNNETYFLKQTSSGHFEYVFQNPKQPITFRLTANEVTSKPYTLELAQVPKLVNFEMVLDYPAYTLKPDEVLKGTGHGTVPEGTLVTWQLSALATDVVTMYAQDTLNFSAQENNTFKAQKRLYTNLNYHIGASNKKFRDYDHLSFGIKVIKDQHPQINVAVKKDSIDEQSLYFYGQVTDDYGLTKLQLVYYPLEQEALKKTHPISISKSNFNEFISAFPNQLQVEEGIPYELYFEVFDNDTNHNYKATKSTTFTYKKLTKDQASQRQLNQQKETLDNLQHSFDKFKEQDVELETLSKLQKEKEALNFNDRQKLSNFLKRQKAQEQLIQNFNKQLNDNLKEFETEANDPFKERLQERLDANEAQFKQNEKLLEALEKLQDKINKEALNDKLEQLAKQNKNKQRSLEQLLELTKRFYVTKKTEKLQNKLEQLAKQQDQLSKKTNTRTSQDSLNQKFEDFTKEYQKLQQENNALREPLEIPNNKAAEQAVKNDQQEAVEQLNNQTQQQQQGQSQEAQKSQQQAQQKQKSASEKMKQMSSQMQMAIMANGAEQIAEDHAMLRQILDNLLVFSFDQETLMKQFKVIDINDNRYPNYLRRQQVLREHFEHVDDSLFALSLRQPSLSESVNNQISNVYTGIDNALSQLSENQLYIGVSSQQYALTATNELANSLSNLLDNMQMQMNAMAQGQGQGKQSGGMNAEQQLQDIIVSQEALNKMMQEGLQQSKEGTQGQESEGSKPGATKSGQNEGNGNEKPNSEALNGLLFSIYQKQQQLKEQLLNTLGGAPQSGNTKQLLKAMERVEMDLINKGFNEATLKQMMNLQHQLLKLDKATFMQGQKDERQSQTNLKTFNNNTNDALPKAKEYFNTTEILNRQSLPLQQIYKQKVQEYFKQSND